MKKFTKISSLAFMLSLTSVLALSNACTATFSDEDGDGGSGNGHDCDQDNDGHADEDCSHDTDEPQDDCDDGSALRFPGNNEKCDGVDNDCDGQVDEGNVCGQNMTNCDQDGDGHCSPGCNDGSGKPQDDCNDGSALQFPNRNEECDGVDNDCDGQVDEGNVCGCQSCNGSTGNGNPTTGSGTLPPPNRTITLQWNVASSIKPTGAAFFSGEYPMDGSGVVGRWTPNGDCTPASDNERLCMLSQNGNVYSCTFQMPGNRYLTFVGGALQSSTATGCMWSFDQGFWQGGGSGANNGIVTITIDNGSPMTVANGGIVQTQNPDGVNETYNGRAWIY